MLVIGCHRSAATQQIKKNMADAADGEDEFEAVDQRLSVDSLPLPNNVVLQLSVHLAVLVLGQHWWVLVALSFGSAGILFPTESKIAPWSYGKTPYTPRHPPLQALLSTHETHPSPLSPGNPLPHVHFPISFSTPFLVFAVQKAQTESGKRSLPTEKELSSRHLCLHTTDQSYAQDSANLQQYVLLRNKLVTQVVIRVTEGFNLQYNNVATQVEEKCCPYYRTLKGLNWWSNHPNQESVLSKKHILPGWI